MNGLAVCAGVGGIELGLQLAIPEYRCVCYIEREAYAAAVLVARMADKTLDEAFIWDDIETFDGKPWRGVVDIISAGIPCQPFSVAGKQKGTADERWLWPQLWRIICEVRPRYIFLENVPGIVRHGFDTILTDLAKGGFSAEWDLFSAAEVGAPHLRRRWFLLAHAAERKSRRVFQPRVSPDIGGSGEDVADTSRANGKTRGSHRVGIGGEKVGRESLRRSRQMANTRSAGLHGEGASRSEASQSCLSASSWWEIEPELGRMAHGIPDRVDKLRALGNAVVPAVAAKAWCVLSERLKEMEGR